MAKVKLVARHNMPEREIKKGEPFSVEKDDAEFLLVHGFAEKPGAKKADSDDGDGGGKQSGTDKKTGEGDGTDKKTDAGDGAGKQTGTESKD